MDWGELTMGFFSKIFKEIDRVLDRRIGIDDPGVRSGIVIVGGTILGGVAGGAIGGTLGAVGSSGALSSKALSEGFKFPGAPQQTVQPPSSFGGDILGSKDRLRKNLADKKNVRSTNITGGIRGNLSTVRPTLMTL